MYTLSNVPTPEIVTEPAGEPLTLTEAKLHLNLSSSDTAHDTIINQYIAAARLQFERDCNVALIVRTMRIRMFDFAEFRFPVGPLASISSVTYFDANNVSQTFASSNYQVDTANDGFRILSSVDLPSIYDRYDAVTINYTIGKHANSTTVDALSKSAMLLLVGHYFENRDMLINSGMASMEAYERICRLLHRSSYP